MGAALAGLCLHGGMYVSACSAHSFCVRVSDVVPKHGSSEHHPCAIDFTLMLPCVSSGLYVLVEFSFSRFVKWYLHRQQVSALLAEEKADEDTCSSSSCDAIESMSGPALGQPRLLCQKLSSCGRCYTRTLPCTGRVLNGTRKRLWCAEGHGSSMDFHCNLPENTACILCRC